MRRLAGLVVGVVVGAALGFVAYLVLRETVIPYSLWSSDVVMWGIIGLVTAGCGYAGARGGRSSASSTGAAPSPAGGGGARVLVGVFLGLLAGGAGAAALAVVTAIAFDISQMEGAYAMGVAFVWMPLGALVGAIAGGIIAARTRSGG